MKVIVAFFILSLAVGCASTRQDKLSNDIHEQAQKVCLSSDGRGQIKYNQKSISFSFESLYDYEDGRFLIALGFPFHGEEKLEINLYENKESLNSRLENSVLAQVDGISPLVVQDFVFFWAEYFKEVISLKNREELKSKQFEFFVDGSLFKGEAKNKRSTFMATLSLGDSKSKYFKRMNFKINNSLEINLFVRNCLENLDMPVEMAQN